MSEQKKLIKLLSEADGGCSHCFTGLMQSAINMGFFTESEAVLLVKELASEENRTYGVYATYLGGLNV